MSESAYWRGYLAGLKASQSQTTVTSPFERVLNIEPDQDEPRKVRMRKVVEPIDDGWGGTVMGNETATAVDPRVPRVLHSVAAKMQAKADAELEWAMRRYMIACKVINQTEAAARRAERPC